MGLISKIEDKLSHGHGKESENKLEKQAVKQEMRDHNSGSSSLNPSNRNPIQNPISSQSGSSGPYIPSQSATVGASDIYDGRQHTGHGGQSSARTTENEFRDNDGYGSQGATGDYGESRGPRQPMDPYSSKGQSMAAAAGTGRTHEQGLGGRNSVDDPNVPRSRLGGVRNSVDSNDPARRENRDAIPTAGGQKLGSGAGNDPYEDNRQHHYGRDAALAGGVGAAGTGAYELEKNRSHGDNGQKTGSGTGSGPYEDGRQHHYGRDAALAGGVGAAGTGAYELEKNRRHGDNGQNLGGGVGSHSREDDQQHHYGRDAALAGGVGAAGTGAYELEKNRRHGDDTGPASKTLGPHSNNLANVLDPRVKPNADQQRSHDTSGPNRSDMSNRMDPRVESDPRRSQDQHHYGRDAALAGGAGVGAYELEKRHRDHEREDRSGPVGSMYSTDDPSNHGRHHHGHHDHDQYEAGQSAARQSVYDQQPSARRNNENISYMNQNRPAPGTQLDDYSNTGMQQQSRDHHPIRDAALAGGAGMGAGALADEGRHHHSHSRERYDEPSSRQGYGQQQDPSYGGMSSSQQQSQQPSGQQGGMSSAIPEGGKLGGAYEAGYRDALAHMEAQMKKQQL